MDVVVENQTTASPGVSWADVWEPQNAPLLTILALDTLLTLVCAAIIAGCILWSLNRRSRRREERDKLGHILRDHYWETEEQIARVVQILERMRQSPMFREVTEIHVFAYKLRLEGGVYGPKEFEDELTHASKLRQVELASMSITINTVRRIERLFDMLTLQLPCKGKCPPNITAAFGSTIYTLAHSTAQIWSDHKGRLIRNLVHYFAGRAAAERFDSSLISDDELETLVMARVPYVAQLYLNDDHFVLQDVAISSDLKADLKNKIRYIDTVLAKNKPNLQSREKNIIEAYYCARELCVKNSFLQNKNLFPDLVSKVGESSKVSEGVVYLRHLLRIMCMSKHLKKVERDDKFFQFLMQLHESLYNWSDTSSMAEILERVRGNILCYLRGLTLEQMLLDKEFTKAKLEHLEKELYRHLNYLTLRQVQQERLRRQPGSTGESEARLRQVGSESSIYTMAMSASSFLMQRQASQDLPERNRLAELQLMHQQTSLDRSSIVSGSSMYATAMSLSSAAEGQPLTHCSPPSSSSPPEGASPNRTQSPNNGRIPMDASEYYETAV